MSRPPLIQRSIPGRRILQGIGHWVCRSYRKGRRLGSVAGNTNRQTQTRDILISFSVKPKPRWYTSLRSEPN